MGHALRLYFPGGMRRLDDFAVAGGLDKISVVAPGMVQGGDREGKSKRERTVEFRPSNPRERRCNLSRKCRFVSKMCFTRRVGQPPMPAGKKKSQAVREWERPTLATNARMGHPGFVVVHTKPLLLAGKVRHPPTCATIVPRGTCNGHLWWFRVLRQPLRPDRAAETCARQLCHTAIRHI
jgi:hypothetical protein